MTKGLRISIAAYHDGPATSFLDLDEIESLQKAMDYIFNEKAKLISLPYYSEVIFSTKDGFQFGAFTKDKEMTLFAKSGRYPYTSFYADFEELVNLKRLVSNDYKILTAD